MEHPTNHRGLYALAAVPPLLVLTPVIGLVVLAFHGETELWRHLATYVLPDALQQTAILLAGTIVIATIAGAGTAWLVTGFGFPGRQWFEWALLLPLAMPTYIVAYAYMDVLHPIGPVQTALRAILGIHEIRGLILPDIRSMPGCIFVMGFALYPYVYLSTRAALMMQSAEAIEAARGLGAAGATLLRRVTLPIASPAIGVGIGLVMMEVLADIGASEFLGVRTLTVAVYVTWTTRGSVEGAAQIALVMLALTFALVAAERAQARRRDRAGGAGERLPLRIVLSGSAAVAAALGCAAPLLIGFVVPTLHLLVNSFIRIVEFGLPPQLATWMWNSARLAALATAATVGAGFLLAFCHRHLGGRATTVLVRISSLGYALPGTVLAVGLLGPMSWFDEAIAAVLDLIPIAAPALSGSTAALVLAYVLRFLAMPVNTLESAYGRIPRTIDDAARGLGAPDRALALRVHLPLLAPAVAASALLVLIDCMKELPATLLLRPLNVETLATSIYAEASRGTYEDGAVAALAIVLVGLIPVVILVRGFRPRPASRPRTEPRLMPI